MMCGGLIPWTITVFSGRFVAAPFPYAEPEVFEARMAWAGAHPSSFRKSSFFNSIFSVIASRTKSAPFAASSKLVVGTRRARIFPFRSFFMKPLSMKSYLPRSTSSPFQDLFAGVVQKNPVPVLSENRGKPMPHDPRPDDPDVLIFPSCIIISSG